MSTAKTNLLKEYKKMHGIYWNFINWLFRVTKVPKNDYRELYKSLSGFELIEKVESYAKRHKEIRITTVDDDSHSGSIMVYIPHPTHGVTMLFIPQCTTISNTWFLYQSHLDEMVKILKEMKVVYKEGRYGNTTT